MKMLLIGLSLFTSSLVYSQAMQFEERYVKYSLEQSSFKNCTIKIQKLEKKGGIHLTVTNVDKGVIGIQMSDETRYENNLRGDGTGSIEYRHEFFVRAWGPYQYQGDRENILVLEMKNKVVTSLKIKSYNSDFPWNRVNSISCK